MGECKHVWAAVIHGGKLEGLECIMCPEERSWASIVASIDGYDALHERLVTAEERVEIAERERDSLRVVIDQDDCDAEQCLRDFAAEEAQSKARICELEALVGHQRNTLAESMQGASETVSAVRAERDALRAQVQRQAEAIAKLRAGLEWALDAGGWRLWYYADTPPDIIKLDAGAGKDATINDSALDAAQAPVQQEQPTRADLLDALKVAACKGPEARAMFERFGIVFDVWPLSPFDAHARDRAWTAEGFAALSAEVRWQGIAFTLYTMLCEIESNALAAIDTAQTKG